MIRENGAREPVGDGVCSTSLNQAGPLASCAPARFCGSVTNVSPLSWPDPIRAGMSDPLDTSGLGMPLPGSVLL